MGWKKCTTGLLSHSDKPCLRFFKEYAKARLAFANAVIFRSGSMSQVPVWTYMACTMFGVRLGGGAWCVSRLEGL